MKAHNNGLQRTAPCGLAAEAGSFGPFRFAVATIGILITACGLSAQTVAWDEPTCGWPIGFRIITPDPKPGVAFYEKLGFIVESYLTGPGREVYGWDSINVPYAVTMRSGAKTIGFDVDPNRKRSTGNRLDLHVSDVDAVFSLLAERGVSAHGEICNGRGAVFVFTVVDPDGNMIFIEPSEFP